MRKKRDSAREGEVWESGEWRVSLRFWPGVDDWSSSNFSVVFITELFGILVSISILYWYFIFKNWVFYIFKTKQRAALSPSLNKII
jgi:hypothetical protein